MHTYIHTYTHTFHKKNLGNQMRAHSRPMAGCGRTPGLKIPCTWRTITRMCKCFDRHFQSMCVYYLCWQLGGIGSMNSGVSYPASHVFQISVIYFGLIRSEQQLLKQAWPKPGTCPQLSSHSSQLQLSCINYWLKAYSMQNTW